MKKFIILLGLILISTSAQAAATINYVKPKKVVNNYTTNNYTTNNFNDYINSKNEYGAKLDAPYLVQINHDWFLGVEGGKDLYQTNANEGYFAYGKLTYVNTLFSFLKDE